MKMIVFVLFLYFCDALIIGSTRGICRECRRKEECPDEHYCSADGRCVVYGGVGIACGGAQGAQCLNDFRCYGQGNTGVCGECSQNTDCAADSFCEQGICYVYGLIGQTCGSTGLRCMPPSVCYQGACSECGVDSDCISGHFCSIGKCYRYVSF